MLLLELLENAADQNGRRKAIEGPQVGPVVTESVRPQGRVLDLVGEVSRALGVGPRGHQVDPREELEMKGGGPEDSAV